MSVIPVALLINTATVGKRRRTPGRPTPNYSRSVFGHALTDRIDVGYVIDEVSFTQVHGELPVRRTLLEHSAKERKNLITAKQEPVL